jgi:multisubunit Na+/H+ antiporter MnhG subunit
MELDIRLPIGQMFSLFGALLAGYGLVANPDIYARSLSVNINLLWGIVLLIFGITMIYLGRRHRGARAAQRS